MGSTNRSGNGAKSDGTMGDYERMQIPTETLTMWSTQDAAGSMFLAVNLLREQGKTLAQQGGVLSQLVELARLERDARERAERSARRWQWTTFLLGILTLIAAVVAVLVTL